MTCPACGEQPKNTAKDFTKAVIEINNPETLVLFRKVVIPTTMGDETNVPASVGKYFNVLLVYEANNHAYLYSSDGIPTLLTSDVAQDIEQKIDAVANDLAAETLNRQNADDGLSDEIAGVRAIATTALQPTDINKTVVYDVDNSAVASQSTVQLNTAKINLMSGANSTKTVSLPVASSSQAGVLNSSTFETIVNNTNNINSLLSGSVAITGLSNTPTQADLTSAWESETGLSTLINRAQILDVTNSLIWTYYTNSAMWYSAPAGGSLTINTFTNSSEGTIKGSTNNGQVFAESDGTGSVNGWDTLTTDVANNKANKLASANLTASSGITKTVTGSGASTAIDMSLTDGGVGTAKIADGAVTTDKLANSAVTTGKIANESVTAGKFYPRAVNRGIETNANLVPTEDTAAAWATLMGSTPGFYLTYYNETNRFTNQPAQYGFLETMLIGNNVYQRWFSQTGGPFMYRAGNNFGWSPSSGAFRQILDIDHSNITLQSTDPGEGATLAAGHFIAVYNA